MVKLFHIIFDGVFYFNFYMGERNKRDYHPVDCYNMVWGGLLYFIIWLIGLPIFAYINILGNVPDHRVTKGIMLTIICMVYVSCQVRYLRKYKFVETVHEQYLQWPKEEQKRRCIRGLFCNVLPLSFWPIISLGIMILIDDYL